MKTDFTTGVTSGAVISECGTFRYRLWREWDADLPRMVFVMLNPSTANADVDDPTIRRCLHFARRENCGRIDVVNLFAFRTAYPSELAKGGYLVGPQNDSHLGSACRGSPKIVLAWGGIHKRAQARAAQVSRGIWAGFPDAETWCLGKTKDGHPRHPLMLTNDTPLVVYP